MNEDELGPIRDLTERVFAKHCEPAALTAAEAAGVAPSALWAALAETGLLALMAPESEGGLELPPSVMTEVLRIAGRYGAPGPLAETMICNWVLPQLGLPLPEGPVMLALDGQAMNVRYAPCASVLVMGDGKAVLLPPGDMDAETVRNLAGEPVRDLSSAIAHIPVEWLSSALPLSRLSELLSLARAALILGALERILELCVTYAGDRVQFGRPIAAFQAVQQQLAALAGAVAAASAITSAAARAADRGSAGALMDAARVRLADSIDEASAIAHQVHGAIGFTREYELQFFTRRLWAWREEGVKIARARQGLAEAIAGSNRESLWPTIVELGSASH